MKQPKRTGRIYLYLLTGILLLSLATCDILGLPPVDEAEAKTMTQSIMTDVATAVSTAMSQAMMSAIHPAQAGARSTTYTMNYSGSGIKVTGTITYDTSTYSFTYKATITFTSYVGSSVTINSGTAYYDFSGTSSSFTGKYSGNFNIVYSGKSHTYSWEITASAASATGSYKIDGYTYTFTGTGSSTTGGSGGSSSTQVATPTFSPAAGTYTSTQSVAISCSTSGATIRYTTDGSTPTSSSGTIYSSSISVSSTKTIKAIAYKSGYANSSVASATYTISSGSSETGICFWTSKGDGGTLTVYVNNSVVGTLAYYFTSTPVYGQSGTLTVTKAAGTYSIKAKDEVGDTWGPESVTLASGDRLLYEFSE